MLKGRLGRMAVVLALGTSAVLGTTTVSEAAPVASVRFTPAALAACPGWGVPGPGAIINRTGGGLGVVHIADGCGGAAYDLVLPHTQDTYHYYGWREAAAAYIGPGASATATLGSQTAGPFYGPGYIQFPDGGNWTIRRAG